MPKTLGLLNCNVPEGLLQHPYYTQDLSSSSANSDRCGSEYFPYATKRRKVPSSSSEDQDSVSLNEHVYCDALSYIGSTKKSKSGRRNGSGLRQLTYRICEKVRFKQTTSYHEVANEFVTDALGAGAESGNSHFDQKNVRRRIYDALNVLMAANIIEKNKKEVRWIGLPDATKEIEILMKKKEEQEALVKKKKEQICELEAQYRLYESLIARNMHAKSQQDDRYSDTRVPLLAQRITLPFLIIHTKARAKIECYIDENHTRYTFDFSLPFSICHEYEIVKNMNIPMIRN